MIPQNTYFVRTKGKLNPIMNKEMVKTDKYEQELIGPHRNSGMETGSLADDYFHIATDLRIRGNNRMGLRCFFKEYNFRLNNPQNIFKKKATPTSLRLQRWGIPGIIRSSLSGKSGQGIDFDQCVRIYKSFNCYQGACRIRLLEIPKPNFVDSPQTSHFIHKDRNLNDILQ